MSREEHLFRALLAVTYMILTRAIFFSFSSCYCAFFPTTTITITSITATCIVVVIVVVVVVVVVIVVVVVVRQ